MQIENNNPPRISIKQYIFENPLKVAAITAVALAALALIVVGSVASMTALSVTLISMGGVALTGSILFGIYDLLKNSSTPEAPTEEPLLAPPADIPKPIYTLSTAMKVFQSEDRQLLQQYESSGHIGTYLEECKAHYPDSPEKSQLQELITIQKTLEDPTGSCENIVDHYRTWLTETQPQPFYLFGARQDKHRTELVLLALTRETAPQPEELLAYLQALQQHYTQQQPLPDCPEKYVCQAWQNKQLTLKKTLHRTLQLFASQQHFALGKFLYKAKLLTKVVENYPLFWKEDPSFKAWVTAALLTLKKNQATLEKPQDPALATTYETILRNMNLLEQDLLTHKTEQAPLPIYDKPFPPLTIESLEKTPSIDFPGIKEVTFADSLQEAAQMPHALTPPASYPTWTKAEDVALMATWNNYFDALFKASQEERADREIAALLNNMSLAQACSLVTTLKEEDKEALTNHLSHTAHLLITLQYAMGLKTLHPSRLAALIKTIALLQTLCQSIASNFFSDQKFDVSRLYASIKDHYYDAGSYQQSIKQSLERMSADVKSDKEVLDPYVVLSKKRDYHYQDGILSTLRTRWYFQSWKRPQHDDYDLNRIHTENDGIDATPLPSSIKNLCGLFLLTQAMLNPHYYLAYTEKKMQKRKEFNDFNEELNKALFPGRQKILNNKELISINENLEIQPLGLKYLSATIHISETTLSLELGAPYSDHYQLGGPVNNWDIRTRLVEGIVSTWVYGGCDEDGFCLDNGGKDAEFRDPPFAHESHRFVPKGLNQNVYKIHEDKFKFPELSLEASRDVQKMQSNADNRPSNTIYTYAKYPHLFSLPQNGEDWQKLFRLNLFSGNALMKELQTFPDTYPVVLARFEQLMQSREKAGDIKAWIFLYKVHCDILACLRDSSLDSKQREQQHLHYTTKLVQGIASAEAGDDKFQEWRTPLHLAYLYGATVTPSSQDDILSQGKSFLLMQSTIASRKLTHSREGIHLADFGARLLPALIDRIDGDLSLLDELLAYRFKKPEKPRAWERVERGVYRSDKLQINLITGQVIYGTKLEGCLPSDIRENPRYLNLFGEDLLKGVFTLTCVQTSFGRVWCTTIVKDDVEYTLYLPNKALSQPLLYRMTDKSSGDQCVDILKISKREVPQDFQDAYLWRTQDTYSVEDAKGHKIYIAEFSGDSVTRLNRLVDGQEVPVLDAGEYSPFAVLDGPANHVITEEKQQMHVTYLQGKNKYVWDSKHKRWNSTIHRGYFLSNKPLEYWIKPGIQYRIVQEKHPTFFASHFDHYHVLENKYGKGKLILPYNAYRKEDKHSLNAVPMRQALGKDHLPVFAVFDLEKNSHAKSKNPLDLLNLAYTLFTQGKYDEALLYLKRSRGVWMAHQKNERLLREKVKEWFLQWPDNTPNGQALKAHVLLMEFSQRDHEQVSIDGILARDEAFLPNLLNQAEQYLAQEAHVDLSLKLSKEELEDIRYLAPRAISWTRSKIAENKTSPLLSPDVIAYYNADTKKEDKDILLWALDQQIQALEARTPNKIPRSHHAVEYKALPLVDLSPWLVALKNDERHQAIHERVMRFVGELKALFNGKRSLAEIIGFGVADDLEYYAGKVEAESTLSSQADLEQLHKMLSDKEKALSKSEKRQHQHLLSCFKLPQLDARQAIALQLKEQEIQLDQLFEKARLCFGVDDFGPLIESGALDATQLPAFKQALLNYFITRTDRKLLGRKKELVQRLQKKPQDMVLREECSQYIQEWRNYDVRQHPFASILLLMEDELGLNARVSQIRHIDKIIANPDAYLHEAMAGGKTTLLRNVFTAIQAKFGYIGGVMTFAPLMAMHHKEYAYVNNICLGSEAYPFYFTRETPRDPAALKLMILHHVKALTRKGKIDQTPAATISIKHSLTELILTLRKADPKTIEEITPTIQSLQKLLRLRARDLSVYADEMDKIFDALKDFNYSVTASGHVLQAADYSPALEMMKCLMTKPVLQEFAHAIKGNRLKEMPDEVFEKHLRSLADTICTELNVTCDRQQTIDYLVKAHQGVLSSSETPAEKQRAISEFYTKTIMQLPDANQRKKLQLYHYYIGVLLRKMKDKMAGVHYGRSEDGIQVKPYAFSAVCQETSQRSFVLATVMETCFDYMIFGLNQKTTQAYVEKYRQKAEEELSRLACESIDATPQGKQFQKAFGIALSQVKEKHLEEIGKKIEKSADLLTECLEEILLRDFVFFTQKLEGHAHQFRRLVAAFSGSSGSPERVKTLPGMIKKHDELIRQKGAIGSVFYALLKDFDENGDMIPLNDKEPLEKVIGDLLQPGDTLVDNSPFFPNMTGSKIVETVSQHSQQPHKLYRFLDAQDDICVWEEGQIRKSDAGVNLGEVITIIDHKAKQGTNLTFAPGKKGIVELDVDTELTTFYQSLMRLRLLGKGYIAKILYKSILENIWSKLPGLNKAGKLAKGVWTLAHNEAGLIKKLHYQANRKEITSIRTAVVDGMMQTVTQIDTLVALSKLEGDHETAKSDLAIISKTQLNPDILGVPTEMKPVIGLLQNLVDQEKKALEEVEKKITALPIDEGDRKICLECIKEGLGLLADPGIIMSPTDLPALMPVPEIDTEATEEIEIEMDQEVNQQQDQEQQVAIEMETEVAQEAEVEAQQDLDKSVMHPHLDEGREWSNKQISKRHIWEQIILEHYSQQNHYLDPHMFPNIWLSSHSLGYFDADNYTFEQQDQQVRERLWLYGTPKKQACIAPKAFVIIDPKGKMGCQLASIKEGDLNFHDWMKEREVGLQWVDAPWDEQDPVVIAKMPLEQRRILSWRKDEKFAKTWEAKAQYFKNLSQHGFYKLDLREPYTEAKLSFVPKEYRQKLLERVALMKVLFVEGSFSSEEKAIVQNWLSNGSTIAREDLEKRLRDYLNRFYPNSVATNELLNIIKRT